METDYVLLLGVAMVIVGALGAIFIIGCLFAAYTYLHRRHLQLLEHNQRLSATINSLRELNQRVETNQQLQSGQEHDPLSAYRDWSDWDDDAP